MFRQMSADLVTVFDGHRCAVRATVTELLRSGVMPVTMSLSQEVRKSVSVGNACVKDLDDVVVDTAKIRQSFRYSKFIL